MIITESKRCTKCGRQFPATVEYFSRDRQRLRAYCKACGIEATASWQKLNKDKVNAKNRNWRANNLDHVRRNESVYRARNQNRIRQNHRRWRKNNSDKIRELGRIYYRARPEVARAAWHRYEARKRSRPVKWTTRDAQIALDYFGGVCAACGRQTGFWHTIAFDHWIPLASPNCPGTVPWNMVPLCHGIDGCNTQKQHRDASEWAIQKFGKRRGLAIVRRIETYLKWRRSAGQQDRALDTPIAAVH